jgi:hypothetical protein
MSSYDDSVPPPPPSPAAADGASSMELGELRQSVPILKRTLTGSVLLGYIHEFEHGFVRQGDDGQVRVCRWDKIAQAYQGSTLTYTNGAYSNTQYSGRFIASDGSTYNFSGMFRDPAITRRAGRPSDRSAVQMQGIIRRGCHLVSEQQLPDAIAALNQGEQLTFGDVQLNLQGITTKKGLLPWSQVSQVGVRDGWWTVRRQGKRLPAVSKKVESTPNVPLLVTLAGLLQQQAHHNAA